MNGTEDDRLRCYKTGRAPERERRETTGVQLIVLPTADLIKAKVVAEREHSRCGDLRECRSHQVYPLLEVLRREEGPVLMLGGKGHVEDWRACH